MGKQSRPGPVRPGPRRKACDGCAKHRVPCDGAVLCSHCQTRGITCTYQRLEDSLEHSPDTFSPDVQERSQTQRHAGPSDKSVIDKASVPFLLNYSGPGNKHPSDVNRVLSLLSTAESGDVLDSTLPSFDIELDRTDLFFENSWDHLFGSISQSETDQNLPLPAGLEDSQELHSAAVSIIDCISRSQMERQPSGTSAQALDLTEAESFFSEKNVCDYVKAYFDQIVRPRSRIVLKSTFHLKEVSVPLLLSLFLMGATCDTYDEVRSKVVEYAEMAECAIFESPVFRKLMYQTGEAHWTDLEKEEMEIIQAGIIMLLLEIASPKPETRRRARIRWYPALVSVARASGLTKIRNEWHQQGDTVSRDEFLKNESCIRFVRDVLGHAYPLTLTE